jgi:siroheme synthase (precorrin-2 oxidase/ferrochelatase)
MRQSLLAIEAHRLNASVSEHLDDLRIFLAVFTKDELTLVVLVLVLSSSPVLSTLLCEHISWSSGVWRSK